MIKEKTLVIVKPDGVQRSLVGDIISRIERTGLKIVAMKMLLANEDTLWKHYDKDDTWFIEKGAIAIESRKSQGLEVDKEAIEYGKDILRGNISFMTSGPVIALIVQGNQSVGVVKKIVGGTEPLTSDVGTIRGDYTVDTYSLANSSSRAVRNLVHCSDKVSEAEREIALWFNESEIVKYNLANERILYDVNLDGILE
ncbi:MAG: nucleoside-diphosphate kinase [Minisyncoccia bacterium]